MWVWSPMYISMTIHLGHNKSQGLFLTDRLKIQTGDDIIHLFFHTYSIQKN